LRSVGQRTWDRLGSAAGLVGGLLVIAALVVYGASKSGGAQTQPGWDAPAAAIVGYASRPAPGLLFVGDGLTATGFLLLVVFLARLLTTLRRAEAGTGWLSAAGFTGGVVYVVLDVARFILTDARYLAEASHHISDQEAVAFFDLDNALTSFTWGAIAMLMIPTALAAIRTRALPLWLGWPALVIGIANLVWAWLPPAGSSTPAELAFLLWVGVTSVVMLLRPPPAIP
jgi:hypothetical protein